MLALAEFLHELGTEGGQVVGVAAGDETLVDDDFAIDPGRAGILDICGSAWKKDPGSGVIGVEKGPLIPLV